MNTAIPILIFLNLIAAAHLAFSFQFHPSMSSPMHKDNDTPNNVLHQASTIDQCWNVDNCSGSEDCINHLVDAKNENDVFWSIFSNAFFLGGGFFYIVGSVWDVSLSNSGDDPQNMLLYYSIWILGPAVYLLNSFVDVIWAVRTMNVDKKRRGLKRFFIRAHQHAANVGCEGDTGRDILLALEKFDMHATSMDEDLIEGARISGKSGHDTTSNVMSSLRRHFGHRRDLSSATTFGIAAMFGTASAIGWAAGSMDEVMVDKLESISIHVYLLSAVFALVGRRQEDTKFSGLWDFFEDAQVMENVGDSLFGIASVIDVLLTDFSFDDDNPWWAVVSAVLWMMDAMFYLRGDFVVLYRKQKKDNDGNETNVEMKGTIV